MPQLLVGNSLFSVTVQVEIFCSRLQGSEFKGLVTSEDTKEVTLLVTGLIQFVTFGIFYF